MHTCEFCAESLDARVPANVALFEHMHGRPDCEEQFEHLLANLNTSWTSSMSGGA